MSNLFGTTVHISKTTSKNAKRPAKVIPIHFFAATRASSCPRSGYPNGLPLNHWTSGQRFQGNLGYRFVSTPHHRAQPLPSPSVSLTGAPGRGAADCVHFLRYVNNRPVLERNQTRLYSIGEGGGRTLLEEPHLILPGLLWLNFVPQSNPWPFT